MGGTNGVNYEEITVHSGSYAGDSPMPGLVHRGIPLPKRQDRQFAWIGPGMPVEDIPTIECYKYTMQGDEKWFFTKPDAFLEVPVDAESDRRFVMECNPANRPELFVVGHKGQAADTLLHIMGETR